MTRLVDSGSKTSYARNLPWKIFQTFPLKKSYIAISNSRGKLKVFHIQTKREREKKLDLGMCKNAFHIAHTLTHTIDAKNDVDSICFHEKNQSNKLAFFW